MPEIRVTLSQNNATRVAVTPSTQPATVRAVTTAGGGSAFDPSNIYAYINLVFGVTNTAFGRANSGVANAQIALNIANLAYNKANAANLFAFAANTIPVANTQSNGYVTIRSSVRTTLNFIPGQDISIGVADDSAGDRANITISAVPVGPAWDAVNAAFTVANTANQQANLAFRAANAVYDFANSVNIKVDAAFGVANTGNLYANLAFRAANAAYDFANSINAKVDYVLPVANTANTRANLAQMASNAAYDFANAINSIARSAYNKANTTGVLSLANTLQSNSYMAVRSTGRSTLNFVPGTDIVIELTDDAVADRTNIKIISTSGSGAASPGQVFDAANGAFLQANVDLVIANLAFDKANAANSFANAAMFVADKANARANLIYTGVTTNTVTLYVSTIGVANAANPLAGDPFDKLSSALNWFHDNIYAASQLVLSVGAGTFTENVRFDASFARRFLGSGYPGPTKATTLKIIGADISTTIIQFSGNASPFVIGAIDSISKLEVYEVTWQAVNDMRFRASAPGFAFDELDHAYFEDVKFIDWSTAITNRKTGGVECNFVFIDNTSGAPGTQDTYGFRNTSGDFYVRNSGPFSNVRANSVSDVNATTPGAVFYGTGGRFHLDSNWSTANCDRILVVFNGCEVYGGDTARKLQYHANVGIPSQAYLIRGSASYLSFPNANIEFSTVGGGAINVIAGATVHYNRYVNTSFSQAINQQTYDGLIKDSDWRPIANLAFDRANVANTLSVGNTMSNGYFTVRSSQRTRLNFLPASANVRINVDDDSAGDRINVTIEAMGSGGGSGTGANLTAANTLANGYSIVRTAPYANINFIGDTLTDFDVTDDPSHYQINVKVRSSSAAFTQANAPVYVSVTAPASPVANSLWWNSENAVMSIYYSDGSSSQWVDVSGGGLTTADGNKYDKTGGPVTGNVAIRQPRITSDNVALDITSDWANTSVVYTAIRANIANVTNASSLSKFIEFQQNNVSKFVIYEHGNTSLYGSYTDASNYERLNFEYDSVNSRYFFLSQRAGSGTERNLIIGRGSDGAGYMEFGGSYVSWGAFNSQPWWGINNGRLEPANGDALRDIGHPTARVGSFYVSNISLRSVRTTTDNVSLDLTADWANTAQTFTLIRANVANVVNAESNSKFVDLQANGVSKFWLTTNGGGFFANAVGINAKDDATIPFVYETTSGNKQGIGIFQSQLTIGNPSVVKIWVKDDGNIQLAASYSLGWASGGFSGAADISLKRANAGNLLITNGGVDRANLFASNIYASNTVSGIDGRFTGTVYACTSVIVGSSQMYPTYVATPAIVDASADFWRAGGDGFMVYNAGSYKWSSTGGTSGQTADLALVRASAGNLLVTDGSSNRANLLASNITAGNTVSGIDGRFTNNVLTAGVNATERLITGNITLAQPRVTYNANIAFDITADWANTAQTFTLIRANIANSLNAGSTSKFIDFQQNGISVFTVTANGNVSANTVNADWGLIVGRLNVVPALVGAFAQSNIALLTASSGYDKANAANLLANQLSAVAQTYSNTYSLVQSTRGAINFIPGSNDVKITVVDDSTRGLANVTFDVPGVATAYAQANVANTRTVANTMSNSYVGIRSSQRSKLNFVPGTNITINVDDDSAGDRVNVTITGAAIPVAVDPSIMETATDNANFVTALHQPRHPGHPKAWGFINNFSTSAAALYSNYGVSSISYSASGGGAGNVKITWTTAFSSANYATLATTENVVSNSVATFHQKQAGTVNLLTWRLTNSIVNIAAVSFCAFGDQ
jgi:hypothetical protein